MNCKADWTDKEKFLITTEIAKGKIMVEITIVVGRYLIVNKFIEDPGGHQCRSGKGKLRTLFCKCLSHSKRETIKDPWFFFRVNI